MRRQFSLAHFLLPFISLHRMMETTQHLELSLGPHTPVNEVHHNGNVHQTQAIENVYYWYDGNVPFCTDATACQPLDDNFLPMNAHGYGYGYWYADKAQWAPPHQHSNVNHYGSTQEYSDPYDMHLHHYQEPFTNVTLFELAPLLSSPASTCTSHSYSSNSESSPGPSSHSDDASSSTLTTPPSEPSMEPPVRSQSAETPVRAPGPRRRSTAPSPDPTNTVRDGVGRRAPKPRRTIRAVQPLACFFCRGRKIACGPPVSLGAGDRTCEPCAKRRLVCEYPAESYRGRRPSASKVASGRPQKR